MKIGIYISTLFCMLISLNILANNDEATAACPNIAMSGTNVTCYGNSNGTAQVAISNGSGNYSISWSNGANVNSINGLPVGTYTVNVLDNVSGCTVVGAFVVGSPDPIAVTETITHVNCFGNSTGAINTTVIGGNGGYNYTWINSGGVTVSTNQNLTGALAGTYTLNISDANGCTFNRIYSITQPAEALNSSAVVTNASCFGAATGAIDIDVWGGTPSYTYSWTSGQSTQDVSGLTSGNYTVTITDFRGCVRTVPFSISQPAVLTGTVATSSVLCHGDPTGSLTVTPAGGTTPYSYSWQNSTTLFAANTPNLMNVVADNYQVTVTDANGCVYVDNATVNQPSKLTLSYTYENVSCYGGTDGWIDLTVLGGSPTYDYVWENASNVVVGTSQDLVNIPSGIYDVLVTDINGCTETVVQEISQPLSPITVTENVVHVKCYGDNTGEIDLDVVGGTPPYDYNWTTGQTTDHITGLIAMTYNYIVVDSKLCVSANSVVVTQPAQPLTVTSVITDVNCFGESNGTIDLTVSGGTTPYVYEWENSSYLLSNTNQDLINYPADNYTYTVTDENDCVETATLVINQPALMESDIVGVNILCHGQNTGSVDLSVTGGVLPYTYLWNNGPISQDQSSLYAGFYEVQIWDDHNCLLVDNIILTEPLDSLSFSFEVEDVRCNAGEDGSIDLSIEGGTSPYFYDWSSGGTLPTATNLTAGFFTFLVTDNNGCTLSDSIYVDEPDALVLNEDITVVTCYGLSDGIIDISPTGGTLPYSYTWYNSSFVLSTQEEDLVDFPADVYQLEVIDSNNCFYEMFVELEQPDLLVIEYTSNVVSCFDGSDANIFVTITGGNPTYNTNWSNGATTEDLLNIPADVYQLTVTDQKNCTDSITVDISEPEPITMTFDVEEVTCIDQHNGIAYAFPEGGNGGYLYNWSNGASSYMNDGLSHQTYSVTVVDVLGCTGTDEVLIPRSDIGCIDPVTAFSPNGDNYNDTWVIDNMYLYPEAEVQIFNRWGNLVHKINGVYEPWSGLINGADAPSDVYYYIINLNTEDREPLVGNITIVR